MSKRLRSNQKNRRPARRKLGIYVRNGIERIVSLHPTKGFRDANTNNLWAKPASFAQIDDLEPERMNAPKSQVVDNKPYVLHKKSG